MSDNGSGSALDALFWKDEILQVLFWMDGEGLGSIVGPSKLSVLLKGDPATIAVHLEKLADEGLLDRCPREDGPDARFGYALSDDGRKEAGRRFADAFEGMQKQGHGECSPDCICHIEGKDACPSHGHDHT